MGTFLLILFIVFVAIPLVRTLWAVYKAKRQFDNFRRQATEAFGDRFGGFGAYANSNSGPSRQARTHRRGKKFMRDVGEYVSFEELPPRTDRCELPPRNIPAEPQIEDAEWEDIR
ncbi:MAG: DUF4834 family protein [Muribaculaceae bacterium]|nr:DUF4834 family protein [Muribaculaceae bacterium]MDE6332434.1 DUF4834 family protein [Muribaculaceae bacterium]